MLDKQMISMIFNNLPGVLGSSAAHAMVTPPNSESENSAEECSNWFHLQPFLSLCFTDETNNGSTTKTKSILYSQNV